MPGIATARGRDGAAPKARLVAPAAIAAQGWRVGGLRRHDLRAIAAPSDFVHVGPAPGGTGGSVYCLCPATGGAILTDVPCRDLIGRRFAYAAQAEAARVVTRAPWSAIDGPAPAAPVPAVFSIGRCGSTLLARVLAAAGAQVLSELDVFTGIGQVSRRWPADPALQDALADRAGRALRHAGAGLSRPVFKFRSQATQGARAICRGGALRPVFLVRRIEDWALSMARTFPAETPQALVDPLIEGLRDISALPDPPILLNYAALVADPAAAARACLGGVPAEHLQAIRAALAGESQTGTALARRPETADPARVAGILALWRDRLPDAALGRLGLRPDLTPERT